MHRTEAIAWVVAVCADSLRLSQAKTLGILVASAMRVERISLANIGRTMVGTVKHQIKRCWRFCANDRIETADAMRGVLRRVLKKRKKKLIVSFDWTDIRSFQTLVASAVFKGRSTPICWASCKKHVYDGYRSRNAFEESLLLVELARFCQNHGFSYVIRIQPNVRVKLRLVHRQASGLSRQTGHLQTSAQRRVSISTHRDTEHRGALGG